jgi:ParB family chromosome partitioning protein
LVSAVQRIAGSRPPPPSPTGHTFGLRQLRGETLTLTPEEEAARAALQAEFDTLEQQYAQAPELPEEVDRRFGEIETALATLEERPVRFEPEEVARAGAFVSIDAGGSLRPLRPLYQQRSI